MFKQTLRGTGVKTSAGGQSLTCFSACLRRSRKRSSSWTQAGSSLWPCCLAVSSCVFSSRSTRSSCVSRACRVRDTCRSSSRSRDVRRSPSRPLTCTGGCREDREGHSYTLQTQLFSLSVSHLSVQLTLTSMYSVYKSSPRRDTGRDSASCL